MDITLLKAKLHKARVTHSELHYEGSCAISNDLIEAAGLREFEQIDIYNVTNGERFTTYVIQAEAGAGIISINGAAARRAHPGDVIIICAYATMGTAEADQFKPKLVYLDQDNRIIQQKGSIPVQAA